ncbi:MAG: nuclear transport factor 2 family protein [Propionibacteriaceae bacterium]
MAKPITESDIADLVAQVEESADALMAGDVDRYLAFIHHAEDYTLLNPAGGPARRGFDDSSESRRAMAQMFQSGSAKLDLIETYASGDLVVLVTLERNHGVVGGLPEQDWSLRVTWVFRRTQSGWELAHRHADPLVHPITAEQLSALAHG